MTPTYQGYVRAPIPPKGTLRHGGNARDRRKRRRWLMRNAIYHVSAWTWTNNMVEATQKAVDAMHRFSKAASKLEHAICQQTQVYKLATGLRAK